MFAIVTFDHYMNGYQIQPLIWTGKIKCVVIQELQQLMQVRPIFLHFFAIFDDFSMYRSVSALHVEKSSKIEKKTWFNPLLKNLNSV